MGKLYDAIDDRLADFLVGQPVFFVATAPLAGDGHINCSPRGSRGDLLIVDGHTVAFRDLTGSGVETIAHLRENGRIVLMFCSFEGPPRVVRLHGRGAVVVAGDPRWDGLVARFDSRLGTRAVITVDVERISDSCGYGVPLMPFAEHRSNLDHWAEVKGADGIESYLAERNAASIDGLPGY